MRIAHFISISAAMISMAAGCRDAEDDMLFGGGQQPQPASDAGVDQQADGKPPFPGFDATPGTGGSSGAGGSSGSGGSSGTAGQGGQAGAAGTGGDSGTGGSGGSAGSSGSSGTGGSAGTGGSGGSTPDAGPVCNIGQACASDGVECGEMTCKCNVLVPTNILPSIQCEVADAGGDSADGGVDSGPVCKTGDGCDQVGATCGDLTCKCAKWFPNPILSFVVCESDAGAGGTGGGTVDAGADAQIDTGSGGTGGSGGSTPDAGPTCTSGQACVTEGAQCADLTCKCSSWFPTSILSLVVCNNDAGADSGTGGSGGSSGAGGSSGSGGTGGSSGSGGNAGTGGSGVDGGVVDTAKDLVITAVIPTGGTHAITAFLQSYARLAGEPDWANPTSVSGATRIVIKTKAFKGSKMKLNGYWDPPSDPSKKWTNAFCKLSGLQTTVALWATWDGQPVQRPSVVSNGQPYGCDLEFTAEPSALISSKDKDGDGYDPNDVDQSKRDCNDADNSFNPGMYESPDDDVSLDCDPYKNPARAVIRMEGISSIFAPVVRDVTGSTYGMTWNGMKNLFETSPIETASAPREFWIEWSGSGANGCDTGSNTCYDNWCWGGCHEATAGVTMVLDTSGALIPLSLSQVPNQNTCHRYATLP